MAPNITATTGIAHVAGTPSHLGQAKTSVRVSSGRPVIHLNNLRPEREKTAPKKRTIQIRIKPKLSQEDRLENLKLKIFKQGLEESVKNVGAAVINLRKNPKSLGAFTRIRAVSEHYVSFLTPSEDPLLKSLQDKILSPLLELFASLKPQNQDSIRPLIPIFPPKPQEEKTELKRSVEEPPKPKRSVQAGGKFPANFDLKTLNGVNGFGAKGITPGDYLGSSVCTAGDFNGDGLDDIVLGAALASPGGLANAGSAFAIFGQRSGLTGNFNLTNLTGVNGFRIDGLTAGGALGSSVSRAGDFNGDGFQDIILGAPSDSPGGVAQAGSVFVIFGNSTGWSPKFNLATLNGINGFSIAGLATMDQLGQSVSAAGDINGDGIDDIILGASGASPAGHPSAGKVYVLFGQRSGLPAKFNLASLNGVNGFVIDGILNQGYLGWSVSAAGDINGDGIDDVVLGAYYASPGGVTSAGTSYLIFGKTTGWTPSFDLSTLNGINGFVVNGVLPNNFLGSSVGSAGDMNGDGIGDVVLGADASSPGGQVQAGSSYILFGHTGAWTSPFNLTTLNGITGFTVPGLHAGDILGNSVSKAGDINGDGIEDVVLGAYFASPGGLVNSGMSSVIFGKTSGWSALFNLTTLDGIIGFNIAGLSANDRLGSFVGTAGDFNGDGIEDVILGAPGNGTLPGESFVIFGTNISNPSPSPIPTSSPPLPTASPPLSSPPGTTIPIPTFQPPTGSAPSSTSTAIPNPTLPPSSSSTPGTTTPIPTSQPPTGSAPSSTSTAIPNPTLPPQPSVNPTSTPSSTIPTSPSPGSEPSPFPLGGIIGIIVAVALAVAGTIGGIFWWRSRKKKKDSPFMHEVSSSQRGIQQEDQKKPEPTEEDPIISRESRDSYRTYGSDEDK